MRVKGKAKVLTGDPQTTSDRPLDRLESGNLPIGAGGWLAVYTLEDGWGEGILSTWPVPFGYNTEVLDSTPTYTFSRTARCHHPRLSVISLVFWNNECMTETGCVKMCGGERWTVVGSASKGLQPKCCLERCIVNSASNFKSDRRVDRWASSAVQSAWLWNFFFYKKKTRQHLNKHTSNCKLRQRIFQASLLLILCGSSLLPGLIRVATSRIHQCATTTVQTATHVRVRRSAGMPRTLIVNRATMKFSLLLVSVSLDSSGPPESWIGVAAHPLPLVSLDRNMLSVNLVLDGSRIPAMFVVVSNLELTTTPLPPGAAALACTESDFSYRRYLDTTPLDMNATSTDNRADNIENIFPAVKLVLFWHHGSMSHKAFSEWFPRYLMFFQGYYFILNPGYFVIIYLLIFLLCCFALSFLICPTQLRFDVISQRQLPSTSVSEDDHEYARR